MSENEWKWVKMSVKLWKWVKMSENVQGGVQGQEKSPKKSRRRDNWQQTTKNEWKWVKMSENEWKMSNDNMWRISEK